MGASENTLLRNDDVDLDEIQDDLEPGEQTNLDSSEETFTDVTLEDINRDDLDPRMQAVYDDLLERQRNMQVHFTQRTQEASQVARDAESWQSIIANPQLAKVLNDAVYRIENGLPLDGRAQEEPETPDYEQDPEGYMRHLVGSEVKNALAQFLPGLQNQMQEVTGFVRGNQANLEFDNLASKYPAAKVVGLPAIQKTQNSYRDSNGRPITMEKAYGIMALDNPSLLQVGSPARKNSPPTSRGLRAERSRTSRGTEVVTTESPVGVRSLQKRIADLRKSGELGLESATRRAVGLLSRRTE